MGKEKLLSNRKQITVYLSAEEYAAVEVRAAGSVSGYVRKLLLDQIESAASRTVREQELPSKSVTSRLKAQIPELQTASELPAKRAKTCPHGKAKGYNCWQCGGLAKIESTS